MKNRKITIITLASEFLYFITVALYQLYQTPELLTIWELLTVASAFIVYHFLTSMISRRHRNYSRIRLLLVGMILCTSMAHLLSIGIVRPLLAHGVQVPTYYQIGHWFSFQMLLDYIGWGLLLGSASILLYRSNPTLKKGASTTLLLCGTLCLLGFIGGLFNQYLWLLAPCAYGVGFTILCLQQLHQPRKTSRRNHRHG